MPIYNDENISIECPNCGHWTTANFPKLNGIHNGASFVCEHCNKTIVIELYTAQDEEDMEAE